MAEQEVIASEKPKLTQEQLIVHDSGEYAMLFDSAKFNQAYRVATAFAQSGLVPDHFKDNPAGVFVVLHMATRMNLDPFMVLQKTYLVHGRPGMEAQLIIALVNARGPFKGPIQWEFEGEGKTKKCTAFATHAKTGELCKMPVDWAMVEAEGWDKKPGSKWKTMPDVMFRYRSATFLARAYCPEVIMGLSTADELEDMAITLDSGVTISPRPKTALPEAPEVDPAAVDEFDKEISARKLDKETSEALTNFVSEIAKVNKQTPEAVKAQASTPANFPTFWKSFLAWHNKPERKPRSDKGSTRRPQEPPLGETATQAPTQENLSPEGGTGPVRGIQKGTLTALVKELDRTKYETEILCQDWEVTTLVELSEEAGQNALTFLKGLPDIT